MYYQDRGITTWLWISAAICVAALLVGFTVLRERRGEVVEEFSINTPESDPGASGGASPRTGDLELDKL
ncbi:hypothetical protein GCM10020255_012860 [Rhodococcus baikonurensis]